MSTVNEHLTTDMPDRCLVETYLELYQHSTACHIFPIVDVAQFRKTVATAYSNELPTHEKYNAVACIYAFLAFSSFFSFSDTAQAISNSDEYASRGHRVLTNFCFDVSFEPLQAATLLVFKHFPFRPLPRPDTLTSVD